VFFSEHSVLLLIIDLAVGDTKAFRQAVITRYFSLAFSVY